MTLASNFSAAPTPTRRIAIAAAIAVAVGLGAPALWLAGRSAPAPAPKAAVRLDAGPLVKRELAFYPQERAADDSIRSFKPGKAWAIGSDDVASLGPAPQPAQASGAPLAARAPAPKAAFAAAPLPPVRPVAFARAAPPAPRYADLPPQRQKTQAEGFQFSKFVPSGGDVVKRIGGLGATMRDSIGTVGSSLGKLIRISSR